MDIRISDNIDKLFEEHICPECNSNEIILDFIDFACKCEACGYSWSWLNNCKKGE